MRLFLFTLVTLVASACAYSITGPDGNVEWTTAGPNTVTWTKASTDNSSIALVLVKPDNSTFTLDLAGSVDGNSDCSRNKNGILSESQDFNITQSSTNTSSTTSSSSTASASGTSSSDNPSNKNSADRIIVTGSTGLILFALAVLIL
ncbi:hypothetical protein BC826DRAFT_85450 [Russula brevipes]|nr:hypothetical protein BC826DRAFT_85450 [Russula brevipes]